MIKHITLPLTEEAVADLKAGDIVRLSGKILVARDAAHKRLTEDIKNGKEIHRGIQKIKSR